MIERLRIEGFAIIDQLELTLEPGLVVLTGETGAGKSIMIDAIELLMGGRADSSVVRQGDEVAVLEAEVRLTDSVREPVEEILRREELWEAGGQLLLGREIRAEGRNICRVNGRVVTASLLREIGDWLVDVHGQSEHLSLLRVSEHLNLLDRFAGAAELLETYQQVHRSLLDLRREIAALEQEERTVSQREEMLEFQINEIETARLSLDEYQGLVDERTRLANAEQLALLAEQALATLEEGLHGQVSASDLLGQAVEAIMDLGRIDSSLVSTADEAQVLLENVADLTRKIRLYREAIEYSPARLDEVEERLALIDNLTRKYGGSIEAVLHRLETARTELNAITHAAERLATLRASQDKTLVELGELGQALSQERRTAAHDLAQAIEAQLVDLHMGGAQFEVAMEKAEDPQGLPVGGMRIAYDRRGIDQVEFLVAPNPGEGLKPLVKIASGGETSRMMLGLKTVLAQADRTPTLIFDEIDQGIGGRIGSVVGEKLWRLAREHQVLCITHLPQLGVFGDQHMKVEKAARGGRTVIEVIELKGAQRTAELALMLGGETQPHLESAIALQEKAAEVKGALVEN